MILLLVALLVIVPIAELAVIVQVAQSVGVLDTIGLLLLSSIVGGALLRYEGFGAIQRVRDAVMARRTPEGPLVDGLLIVVGGMLMLVPGFVSDAVGLLLLLPPVRALLRPWVIRRARRRWGLPDRRDAATTVIDVESWEEPPTRPIALSPGDHG